MARLAVIIAALAAMWLAASPARAVPPDGQRVYEQYCSGCHGITGRPAASNPMFEQFDRLPADFSDPLFASREPVEHWLIVAAHGGPALGFSERMPAFLGPLSSEQLAAAVAYAKGLAPGVDRYPPGDLNFFLGLRTRKAFPEDEVVWKLRPTTRDGADVLQNRLEIEKRVGRRWQVSAELVHELEAHHGNLSEIEPGVKYVAYWNLIHRFIASVGLNAAVPLNQSDTAWAAVPFVAIGKGLGEHFTVQASARANLPADELARDGDVELASVVHFLPPGMRPRGVFPGLELTALVPFEPGDRDAVQVALAPKLRIGLTKRGHVALNLGVQVPLNEGDVYDFRGYAYLIWDFADGMIWEAW